MNVAYLDSPGLSFGVEMRRPKFVTPRTGLSKEPCHLAQQTETEPHLERKDTAIGGNVTPESTAMYPSSSPKTKSIPISRSALTRTASEIQLMENEAMADYRDYCMFNRIVTGLSEQHHADSSECIDNIIRTRTQAVPESGQPNVSWLEQAHQPVGPTRYTANPLLESGDQPKHSAYAKYYQSLADQSSQGRPVVIQDGLTPQDGEEGVFDLDM